jgi:hypothetical protein
MKVFFQFEKALTLGKNILKSSVYLVGSKFFLMNNSPWFESSMIIELFSTLTSIILMLVRLVFFSSIV